MHASITTITDPETGVAYRAPRRQTRFGHVRQVAPILDHRKVVKPRATGFQLACEWVAPWSLWAYPGHTRILLQLFGSAISDRAIGHWKREVNNPPVWAVRALQAYIRNRCAAGLRLADALEPYAERRALTDQRLHLRGLR